MALGCFEVHAGDFKPGNHHQLSRSPLWYFGGKYREWRLVMDVGSWRRETVPVSQVVSVEVASEEAFNRLGGVLGWGLAGDVLFGPVGLLAGLIRGGRGKKTTFICSLKDGRKFLATAPSGVFSKIQLGAIAEAFDHGGSRAAAARET